MRSMRAVFLGRDEDKQMMKTTSTHLEEQPEGPAQGTHDKNASIETPNTSRAHLLWLLRVVGWGVLLVLCGLMLVNQVFTASREMSDFCQDYTAARRLTQGIPVYLPLRCWSDSGIVHVPAPLEYDAHPPPSILLIWPLSLLPMVPAAALWGLISLAAYLTSGFLLLRALGWRSLRNFALFVVGSLFWQPFIYSQTLQNTGQMLLVLLVGAWLLERRNAGWAGALIGLAGLLRVWPAVLLLVALIQHRWRLFWSGITTLLLGTIVTTLAMGPGAYAAYLGPVRASELYWIPTEGNISLVSAVVRPLTGYRDPPLVLSPLVSGVGLEQAALLGQILAGILLVAALVLLWWCGRRAPGEPVNLLSQGLMVTVLLLIFPLTWLWELILLLLPLTTIILALRQLPRPPRRWFALVALGLLPQLGPYYLNAFLEWLASRQVQGLAGSETLLFGVPTYGLLLFAGAQAWLLWKASDLKK